MREIHQHDGVVVDAAGISAGLRQALWRRRRCRRREGCAREEVRLPSLSLTIYRGKGVEEAP